VIGFSKCGTMSLVEYLKKKHPGCEVSRPENIYQERKETHYVQRWNEWVCCVITRNPVDRIHSCHQYWAALRSHSVQDILKGKYHGAKNYFNVGAADLIGQSNYEYYIKKFERYHGLRVRRYHFEDLKGDPDFPHINESDEKLEWSPKDREYVKACLSVAGITY